MALAQKVHDALNAALVQQALFICRHLQEQIKALIHNCHRICAQLHSACFDIEQAIVALDPDHFPSPANNLAMRTPSRDRTHDPALATLSGQFLSTFADQSWVNVITLQTHTHASDFVQKLELWFQQKSLAMQQDTPLLQQLIDNREEKELVAQMQQVLKDAAPLLPLEVSQLYPKALIIGLPSQPSQASQYLSNLWVESLEVPSYAIDPTPGGPALVCLKLSADFPLGTMFDLGKWQQAYQKGEQLHCHCSQTLTHSTLAITPDNGIIENTRINIKLLEKYRKSKFITDSDLQWLQSQLNQGNISQWEFDDIRKRLLT